MTDYIVHYYSEAAVAFLREMLGSLPARPCSGIGLRAYEIAGSVVLTDMNIHNHIQDTWCTGGFRRTFFSALDTDRRQYAAAGGVSAHLQRS